MLNLKHLFKFKREDNGDKEAFARYFLPDYRPDNADVLGLLEQAHLPPATRLMQLHEYMKKNQCGALEQIQHNAYFLFVLIQENVHLNDTSITDTLRQLMQLLSAEFLRNYREYTEPSESLWHYLYAVFALLETRKAGRNTTQMRDKLGRVKNTYLKILLISCANPYHLNPHDINDVYEFLDDYASQIVITPKPSATTVHYIDLKKGIAPKYFDHNTTPISKSMRFFDFSALEHELQTQLSAQQGLSSRLLRHLIQSFKHKPVRNFSRVKSNLNTHIVIGFDYVISHNRSNSHQDDQALFNANIVNHNPGGVCLELDAAQKSQIQTGQLIAIANSPQDYLGVIRWIKKTEQEKCYIGVQIVAPKVSPIKLFTDHDERSVDALLIEPVPSIGQPLSVILTNQNSGKAYKTMLCDATLTPIKLVEVLDQTANYCQFHIKKVKQ